MSISSDDDTDSTESDGEYYSELHPDVDAADGVDSDGGVDMDRDHENEH